VFNNIKIILHYNNVYMRTSGEKVRISDEAERVQSVSYSHISIARVISVRHGDAGDAIASPTMENWPFFEQKF